MTRVVITGMGALTPIGNSVPEFEAGLRTAKVGFQPITHFDASENGITLAGELHDFEPLKRLGKRDCANGSFSQYAMYATAEAVEQAGIDEERILNLRPWGHLRFRYCGDHHSEQVIKMVNKGAAAGLTDVCANGDLNMASGNMAIPTS